MTDLLATVQAELSAQMIPWPDDYVETLTPPAALFLLRQCAMATMKVIAGGAIALDDDPDSDSGPMGEIMNGVAACVAGATHACVALELLPPEAEEAMTT